MLPPRCHRSARLHQRGVSAVLLVAMLVFLASLTAYTLHFVGAAQGTRTMDLMLSRADQAAKAALEWQRYQLRNQPLATRCAALTNIDVPLSTGLMRATVTCAVDVGSPFNENGTSVYSYTFTATACSPAVAGTCPVTPDASKPVGYVERAYTSRASCSGAAPATCTW